MPCVLQWVSKTVDRAVTVLCPCCARAVTVLQWVTKTVDHTAAEQLYNRLNHLHFEQVRPSMP